MAKSGETTSQFGRFRPGITTLPTDSSHLYDATSHLQVNNFNTRPLRPRQPMDPNKSQGKTGFKPKNVLDKVGAKTWVNPEQIQEFWDKLNGIQRNPPLPPQSFLTADISKWKLREPEVVLTQSQERRILRQALLNWEWFHEREGIDAINKRRISYGFRPTTMERIIFTREKLLEYEGKQRRGETKKRQTNQLSTQVLLDAANKLRAWE